MQDLKRLYLVVADFFISVLITSIVLGYYLIIIFRERELFSVPNRIGQIGSIKKQKKDHNNFLLWSFFSGKFF